MFINFINSLNVLLFWFPADQGLKKVFIKNKWINWPYGVDDSDDVTTTKAIRRVNDKMFLCFDTSMSTIDS